jgi:hypothetical protein
MDYSPVDYNVLGETALRSLRACMSTPQLSGLCIMEALGSLSILVIGDQTAGKARVPQNIVDVSKGKDAAFSITARWLSFRRDPAQINKILAMSCTCSHLSSTTNMLHTIGSTIADGAPAQMLIFFSAMRLCELHKQVKDVVKVKLHNLHSRNAWPYSSADLLPHGPEQTLRGYLDWLAADDASSIGIIAQAFTAVVEYTWPITIPLVVKKRIFLDEFVTLASLWSKRWTKFAAHDRRALRNMSPNKLSDMFRQVLFALRMVSAEFVEQAAVYHYLQIHHEDILSSCNHITSTTFEIHHQNRTPESKEILNDVTKITRVIGGVLYFHYPDSLARSPQRNLHSTLADLASFQYPSAAFIQWSALIEGMRCQYVRQTCACPDCTRTTEKHGRPFRYCTGCLWVPFCSSKCQKQAWRRTDGLQHRDVCKLIRMLRSRLSFPHKSNFRVTMRTPPPLSQQDRELIDGINTHFRALSSHDLARVQ